MKVTFHDLGRRVKDVLLALDRNASVTILYQGTENAVLSPSPTENKQIGYRP